MFRSSPVPPSTLRTTPARVAAGLLAGVASVTPAFADSVPLSLFQTPEGLEVTVWAESPQLFNPTNIDIDAHGRIWVAEGVNYRGHYDRKPEGDCIRILEDSDGDGHADTSHVFVQEPFLRAPLGIAVIGNRVLVSMTPDLVVYTDVDGDLRYDPDLDRREVLLTGFNGRVHDHSLHSVTLGPDGQYYWNAGNCGALFTDRSNRTFRIGSAYDPWYGRGGGDFPWTPREIAGSVSDDGHVYVGGFAARMNPDGTQVRIIGHNFRNSYEQFVTSFGDVFQNDNDDPPASRTAFLMEYGNAGFCSFDGQRAWQADRRPGQATAIAEWRQEDPGTMPAGDVYGGGSPTGIVFYENGALGPHHAGMLLSCEPARNVVFGYHPQPDGAGFRLERFDFLTTNMEGAFAGTDFEGGGRSVTRDLKTMFRPSDVAVGPDGAVYVSDWYDPRVGGHQDLDDTLSGTIYRVAPKGFRPRVPEIDLDSTKGRIRALLNPAVHVRALGQQALVDQGESAVPAVAELLAHENPWFRARAVWILSQIGREGIRQVRPLLRHEDPQHRVVAFRALRRHGNIDRIALRLARDPSPAVRREVALAMRDRTAEQALDVLAAVAEGYDGNDRTYLEALGTGATGKEKALYERLHASMGAANPLDWSDAFADIAWRLTAAPEVRDFKARALADSLDLEDRKAALVALGYRPEAEAAHAMVDIAAESTGTVKSLALWWLLNRKDGPWREHGIDTALRESGLFDPANAVVASIMVPEPPPSSLPPLADIMKIQGDADRGRTVAARCHLCHSIDGAGNDFGPALDGWAQRQTTEVLFRSIIEPSADIAHGFNGYEVTTTDGHTIHGLLLSDGRPLIIQSMGGVIQNIPADRVASKRPLGRSLMMSPEQLGLTPQDVADVAAYLKRL